MPVTVKRSVQTQVRATMSKAAKVQAAAARKFLRCKSVEFDSADADGDLAIDFDAFSLHILPQTAHSVIRFSEDDKREWWKQLDADASGWLSKHEIFLYALCAASRKLGTGIEAIFCRYDADDSGSLDELEWAEGARESARPANPRPLLQLIEAS